MAHGPVHCAVSIFIHESFRSVFLAMLLQEYLVHLFIYPTFLPVYLFNLFTCQFTCIYIFSGINKLQRTLLASYLVARVYFPRASFVIKALGIKKLLGIQK